MRYSITEVKPGYDIEVSFITYKGAGSEEAGTFTHTYRKNR